MRSHFALAWCIITFCLTTVASSQGTSAPFDDTPYRDHSIGGYGSAGINFHSADITGLPGIPSCCPEYSTGSGFGFAIGGLYDHVFSTAFSVLTRLSLMSGAGTLTATETTLLNTDGTATEGTFLHTLNTSRLYITLEPLAQIEVTGGLRALLGPTFGFVTTTSFDQEERIQLPDDAVFENGQKTRFVYDGEIPDASSLYAGIVAGLRYELPLNDDRSVSVVPEVTYTYGLTSLQSSDDWSMHSVRAGVAVQWNSWVTPQAPPPPPPPAPEPPPPPAPVLPLLMVSGFTANLIDSAGQQTRDSVITVTNIVSTNLYALLNYVFFDDSSDVIPSKYQLLTSAEADAFDVKSLNGTGTMPIYYHVLNIVGLKLRNTPDARITLIGCNSNVDREKGNTELSRSRAERVRQYFTDVWGISPSRIAIKERNLPEVPSNITTQDGIEENRRVEIVASDRSILEPLYFTDTTRTSSAPIVRFRQNVSAEAGLATWEIIAEQGGDTLKSMRGKGDDLTNAQDWNIGTELRTLPTTDQPIRYTIKVVDADGQQRESVGRQIDVKQVIRKDKRIEKFTLIIFGFNEAEFTDAHERIIAVIKQRIAKNSTVTVEGFTDRSGEAEYNQKLSERRASATARRLNVPADRAIGYGSSNLLYDNSTPEGRLYCRTVLITVETPLE